MKPIYTGKHEELSAKQLQKFESKLVKVTKLFDRRGEKETHVILTKERYLHCVEITMNAFDHTLIGASSDGDLFTAMSQAIEKLEKQVVKMRTKWRDTHRHTTSKETAGEAEAIPVAAAPASKRAAAAKKKSAPAKKARARVFRVDHNDGHKPMTLEEAMHEMSDSPGYLVYRDAKTDRVSVLLRRGDGHLDLIES